MIMFMMLYGQLYLSPKQGSCIPEGMSSFNVVPCNPQKQMMSLCSKTCAGASVGTISNTEQLQALRPYYRRYHYV